MKKRHSRPNYPAIATIAFLIILIVAACGNAAPELPEPELPEPRNACERAYARYVASDSLVSTDDPQQRAVFDTCTYDEWVPANERLTTERTRAPAGWVDRRCLEYSRADVDPDDLLLCRTASE